jgi:cobalt-zinc-cadmium efflux system outer membrane protein
MEMCNEKYNKILKYGVMKFIFVIIWFYCVSIEANDNHLPVSSLSKFVQCVIQNNPAIRAAKENVCAERARYVASSQPIYNPALVAEAQKAIEDTYLVGINQTIDIANKRGAKSQIGAANLCVAKMQLANLEQQLTADLLNALITYNMQKRVVDLAKQRTSMLQRFFTLSKKLHASGDITRVDVDLAQLAYSGVIAEQAQAEVKLKEVERTLRAITGCDYVTWPTFPSKLPCLAISDEQVDCLLRNLPGFHVLNNQYLSARAKINLAHRERIPDPTIGIQGGRQLESEESKTLVGVTLSVPLFIRNPYRAEVAAASADAAEADQKRCEWIRNARAEIKTSAEQYIIYQQAMEEWERLSNKPLKDGINLIERLWQAGELSTTEYLVQLRQRVDTLITGASFKSQAWQAWVSWLKASGQAESWLCAYSH